MSSSKEQTIHNPPQDNAMTIEGFNRRRSHSRHCFYCIIITLMFLLVVFTAGTVIYLVFQPSALEFSLKQISIKGLERSNSCSTMISPRFDIGIKIHNPSNHIGIYFERRNNIFAVFYSDFELCNSVSQPFYVPPKGIVLLQTALMGYGLNIPSLYRKALMEDQKKGKIIFKFVYDPKVKFKAGSMKTRNANLRVTCEVTMDGWKVDSRIVSSNCDVKVGFGFYINF